LAAAELDRAPTLAAGDILPHGDDEFMNIQFVFDISWLITLARMQSTTPHAKRGWKGQPKKENERTALGENEKKNL
jgi:hypothetical protein